MKQFSPLTVDPHTRELSSETKYTNVRSKYFFLSQIFALLFVRGKPYSGQDIVSELLGRDGGCGWLWLGPLTSFSWNIIVPVGLLVLSISSFKSGHYREVSGSTL